jgi:hypothetical protein
LLQFVGVPIVPAAFVARFIGNTAVFQRSRGESDAVWMFDTERVNSLSRGGYYVQEYRTGNGM